jgi:hypothetical protein
MVNTWALLFQIQHTEYCLPMDSTTKRRRQVLLSLTLHNRLFQKSHQHGTLWRRQAAATLRIALQAVIRAHTLIKNIILKRKGLGITETAHLTRSAAERLRFDESTITTNASKLANFFRTTRVGYQTTTACFLSKGTAAAFADAETVGFGKVAADKVFKVATRPAADETSKHACIIGMWNV